MRHVLICGGRGFTDADRLNRILDAAHARDPFACVIHGDYRGADKLAKAWAESRGVPDLAFPPQWIVFGKAAGPIRNQEMLDEGKPDIVVAFPGGDGTADMIRRADKRGIPVRKIKPAVAPDAIL